MREKKFVSIGECMLEFANLEGETYRLGFAGDTYNVAYYCRNCSDITLTVDYATALGDDLYSEKMLAMWQAKGIGTTCVRSMPGFLPGLYLLYNDQQFERHFYYYRREAPVRRLFDGKEGDVLIERLLNFDVIYFSGITLAVMQQESREKFIALLSQLKNNKRTIVFDNNYRPKLWDSLSDAKQQYNRILHFVDIALPSYDDDKLMFGDCSIAETAKRLQDLGCKEVVVKAGEKGYFLLDDVINEFVEIVPVTKLVDTSGAGDSFNGAYLAKRLMGSSMKEAAHYAAGVAAAVVQYKGAILPEALIPTSV